MIKSNKYASLAPDLLNYKYNYIDDNFITITFYPIFVNLIKCFTDLCNVYFDRITIVPAMMDTWERTVKGTSMSVNPAPASTTEPVWSALNHPLIKQFQA